MQGIAWAVVLLAVGLGVIVLEVFVPSGGVLGFVSVLAIVSAVATAFIEQGPLAGFLFLGMTIVLVPAVLVAAFRWFPVTPLGRRVLPPPPDAAEVVPQRAAREAVRRLVGSQGVVVDELVPWGRVRVGDHVVEAMSEGGVIGAGEPVEVIGSQGLSIVVRRREAAAAPLPQAPAPFQRPAPRTEPAPESDAGVASGGVAAEGESGLNEALESFDFGKLDPPSA